LKLIAVAGTHGKTTTTSLFVWAFQQLGIPISYSVGTTMSFGPSGHYDPASEYFVYECDEYDRNFLTFHPYLSIIPALSYDHQDTYATTEDYVDAFRQFLTQSQASIIWRKDADLLGIVENAWVLDDGDMAGVQLVGEHNRRNASLVIKAFERLGISGDVVGVLSSFPGVDRRFEKLAINLYTDYAIHPVEIASTLKLAREINDTVVLVYQPHQNVRQHQVAALYADDIFEDARDVYWLPTYLTRENPDLAILTPQELAGSLKNVHFADLDDELWVNIQRARDDGALVVCMGAGSIDGWVREKAATRHAANTILTDTSGTFLLQQRDDIPTIRNPGQISGFGGRVEPDDASLLDAATRELHEETNLNFTKDDLRYLTILPKTETDGTQTIVAYYTLTGIDGDKLEIYEGQGVARIEKDAIDTNNLTPLLTKVLHYYIAKDTHK
jgi:UDP-N-acetylmuramate--alanine ligase